MPINPLAPMLMFAILFGLSMDYEVFLLSRVREQYLKHRDPKRAVVEGVGSTARVITSAALIMISVFGAFILSTDVTAKLFGVGLGVAVLLDVTLVRMVLVPAAMSLLGHRAWWLPRSAGPGAADDRPRGHPRRPGHAAAPRAAGRRRDEEELEREPRSSDPTRAGGQPPETRGLAPASCGQRPAGRGAGVPSVVRMTSTTAPAPASDPAAPTPDATRRPAPRARGGRSATSGTPCSWRPRGSWRCTSWTTACSGRRPGRPGSTTWRAASCRSWCWPRSRWPGPGSGPAGRPSWRSRSARSWSSRARPAPATTRCRSARRGATSPACRPSPPGCSWSASGSHSCGPPGAATTTRPGAGPAGH